MPLKPIELHWWKTRVTEWRLTPYISL